VRIDGSKRRLDLLDDSIFRNVRFAMYYNIIQYAPDSEEITDAFHRQPVTLDIAPA
jgi:hypothetical protein